MATPSLDRAVVARAHRSVEPLHNHVYFAPETDEAWIADYIALDDQVGAEDRGLVERVHAGMRVGAVDEGVLLPVSERLIAEFQSLVADVLGAA